MDITTLIDVTGISKASILKELHNRTIIPETMVCIAQAVLGDISEQEASEGVMDASPFFPDYYKGRPIKAFLKESEGRTYLCRADLYDRDAGEGKTAEALDAACGGCFIEYQRNERREAETSAGN